jgi:hypothetical protein
MTSSNSQASFATSAFATPVVDYPHGANSANSSSMHLGAIIGGVLGGLAGTIMLCGGFLVALRRSRRRKAVFEQRDATSKAEMGVFELPAHEDLSELADSSRRK